ncbi:hypothetical protein MNBD_GAMMA22-2569 [hydrothermal vent metagenome]|uniref:Integral membrane protein n=1 Tax=hydrothermal vent metagenome TaxID=652676 RepID=A0A3B1B4G4_9ZZZZ
MKKIFGHTAVFLILYILFMLPTYLLPFLGSNSTMLNAAGVASGYGLSPTFWLHLLFLGLLILITGFRAINIAKPWLVLFPILVVIFDFVPLLNSIPLVPTILHLLTIIIGATSSARLTTTAVNDSGVD